MLPVNLNSLNQTIIMNRLILIFFLFGNIYVARGQNAWIPYADSLFAVWQDVTLDDSLRLDAMRRFATEIRKNDPDSAIRIAEEMIFNLRGAQILRGARGHHASDVDSVIESLLRLSQLLSDFPEITELDINPLRVLAEGEGCMALDARMILARD